MVYTIPGKKVVALVFFVLGLLVIVFQPLNYNQTSLQSQQAAYGFTLPVWFGSVLILFIFWGIALLLAWPDVRWSWK
ncbi:MAG: hypothetical protein KGI38_11895 [Thaumarchaeota archaeon]|nr:hypothetical protein [Nitrososphaerota archaeon]